MKLAIALILWAVFCAAAFAADWEENFAYEKVVLIGTLDIDIERAKLAVAKLQGRRDCIAASPDRRTMTRCAP